MTPLQFEQQRSSMSHIQVCRQLGYAVEQRKPDLERAAAAEAVSRGYGYESCRQLVEANNRTAAAIGIAAILLGAAVAASRGGGGAYVPPTPVADYDWAWDLQHNALMQPVWVCRGVQSGQYAELHRCQFKLRNDYRWPGLGR